MANKTNAIPSTKGNKKIVEGKDSIIRSVEEAQNRMPRDAEEKRVRPLLDLVLNGQKPHAIGLGKIVDVYDIEELLEKHKRILDQKIERLTGHKEEMAKARLEEVEEMVLYAKDLRKAKWEVARVNRIVAFRIELKTLGVTSRMPKTGI